MTKTIEPGAAHGSIVAPPSKSHTQRAYAAALLHKGKTIIRGAGDSDDERAALNVIQQLGATVERLEGGLQITSQGVAPVSDSIDCGESGLCARLFTPIAALSYTSVVVTGSGTLLQRPMDNFQRTLPLLDVHLPDFSGNIPFTVQGPLKAKSISIDAGNSSQFLSGLLFALSYAANEATVIDVAELKSKPYIDLTLDVLKQFGRPIRNEDHRRFIIDPRFFTAKDTVEVNIEGDWSGAAFFLAAGAIAGNVTVGNLHIESKQADRAILDVLARAGAEISITGTSVSVRESALHAFEFDATDCPDLFPVLSILAACCHGESCIQGVHRLFHKESNRVESISEMLENFGIAFSLEDDALCITGAKKLQGTTINSYHDHRIVMAAAIGALRASSRVDIENAKSVNKSYPSFFSDFKILHGDQ